MIKRHWRAAILSTLAGTVLGSTTVHAGDPETGQWKISTGFDYSSGDYGESQDTDITYIPVTVRYLKDPWLFKLTVPWIRIKGPGGVIGGGPDGPVVTGGGSQARRTESGLGDVVASVGYALPGLMQQGTFVEFTGKVKFGTADEDEQLGTGENDYTFQVDVAQQFGAFTPFGTLGYRKTGDSNEFDLEDVFFVSLGAGYKFTPATSAGLIYDFREASSSTSEDPQEIVGYVSHKLSDLWALTAYAATGFSDGSPDANIGFQITYTVP